MTTYAYYPGCSLETLAAAYHVSTVEVGARLGLEFTELEDWNCCGATTYSHVDELLSTVLGARNLAMAEETGNDLVAPCSACFKNLSSADQAMRHDADLAEHMNYALEADDLSYDGGVDVRHVVDVFAEDVGFDRLREESGIGLGGLKVAAYYGCQIVRPRKEGDELADVRAPRFFEDLMESIGGEAVEFPYRLHCCGASLIVSNRTAALHMLRDLLRSATAAGAEVIATACPLCQANLEVYRAHVNHEFGTDFDIPIMYFTQLMGMALGIKNKKLGIGKEIVSTARVAEAVAACRKAAATASGG